MDKIDWRLAQRIGEFIAGSPPPGGVLADAITPLADEYARRVSDYARLPAPDQLPTLEMVDRPEWIAANLQTMRPMLEPLAQRMDSGAGPLASAMNSASGLLLGAQVGAVAGVLSQRVLGQYDLALLDATVPPRLLLVAPNLDQAARNLWVDRAQLISWVTIHEVTHAVQFTGTPWLRDHLGGILTELIRSLDVSLSAGGLMGTLSRGDMRELAQRLRGGEVLRLTLGEHRWKLVERMQATMSLIEGHAEHVMDVVGAEVLPSLSALRTAMSRRRSQRGLPWRVLERLLGLQLKLRQYEVGRAFCDTVVQSGGPQALALAWRSESDLPSAEELSKPDLWLARVT